MKRGCRFSFHVCVIVAAIVYIYFSTVFIFIDQWFGLGSSPGLLNAAVFTCLALMCVYTYALAIFTDPGRIPASYVPDVEDADTPMHEIKRKGGDLRYCQKCALHKPPRAHHCRVCNQCVLRMDGLILASKKEKAHGVDLSIYGTSNALKIEAQVQFGSVCAADGD